jgi:parvulin-like peptidyl-prolyl isomerase
VLVAALGACSPATTDPSPTASMSNPRSASTGVLSPGIVGRVGTMDIRGDGVQAVAKAQGVDPARAFDLEARDALFASAALVRHYDDAPSVRAAVRGQLARNLLADVRAEVDEPAPTDAEVADATARHFIDLDRPETFRVIHAVVRLPDAPDEATRAQARAVAEKMQRALEDARDPRSFRELAEGVGRGGLQIVVEELKPVASDGRIVDLDRPNPGKQDLGHYVPAFARAAARLTHPGQKSDVVETEFGFHVLMLLERMEGHTVPAEERRSLLRDEIVAARAKRKSDDLLRALRSARPPAIDRSAETLIRSLEVPPP